MKAVGIAPCTAANVASTKSIDQTSQGKHDLEKARSGSRIVVRRRNEQCSDDSSTFTLYRNSVLDAKMRLHVASFDTADGAAYNQENCALAQQLFQAQPGVKTQFWCEPGRFHKTALPNASPPAVSKQFTTGAANQRTCNPSASELARPGAETLSTRDCRCPN